MKYYAEITHFDELVGQMRAELESRGLWDNTLFIVCSEQGTQFPFAKWTCYDNGLRTGLVMNWAGVTRPGAVSGELLSIADITPTLVEVAGGILPAGACDGQSFLKTLRGEQQTLHDSVFGAFTNCKIIGNRERIYPIRVIRDKSFSLIHNPNHESLTSNVTIDGALSMLRNPEQTGRGVAESWVTLSRKNPAAKPLARKLHHRPEFELYHLDKDPHELNNIIDNPEYQAVAEKLKKQLRAKLATLGDRDPIATEKALVQGKRKK